MPENPALQLASRNMPLRPAPRRSAPGRAQDAERPSRPQLAPSPMPSARTGVALRRSPVGIELFRYAVNVCIAKSPERKRQCLYGVTPQGSVVFPAPSPMYDASAREDDRSRLPSSPPRDCTVLEHTQVVTRRPESSHRSLGWTDLPSSFWEREWSQGYLTIMWECKPYAQSEGGSWQLWCHATLPGRWSDRRTSLRNPFSGEPWSWFVSVVALERMLHVQEGPRVRLGLRCLLRLAKGLSLSGL